jgi:hypothetical protein
MMTDYIKILDQMEVGVAYTGAQLGVAAASLGAMGRRGMVNVIDEVPKRYIKNKEDKTAAVLKIVAEHLPAGDGFIVYQKNHELGMFCFMKSGRICDCYYNPYSVSEAEKVVIHNEVFNI